MQPVQLHSTYTDERSVLGIDLEKRNGGWLLVALVSVHSEQDTTKSSAAKQGGIFVPPNQDVVSAPQRWLQMDDPPRSSTIDCADQLHRLQERLDFLEMYVFELLPRPTQQKLDALPKPTLTEVDVQYMLELIKKAPLTTIPEGK